MRGYYRVPKKAPANRVEGALADLVREKFSVGWPKARIAREFRLNRRTVAHLCGPPKVSKTQPAACAESSEPILFASWRRKRRFLLRHSAPYAQNRDEPN
jgi:hypothetical protein